MGAPLDGALQAQEGLPPREPSLARSRILTVQRSLVTLGNRMEQCLLAVCGLLLIYLSLILFLQVTFRYALKQPLPWSEESARYALVWFSMLSSAVAARRGLHFSLQLLIMRFVPARAHFTLAQMYNVLITAFLAMVLLQSFKYLRIVANQTTIATNMNMQIPYGSITAGVAALLAMYLLELADALCSRFTGHLFTQHSIKP